MVLRRRRTHLCLVKSQNQISLRLLLTGSATGHCVRPTPALTVAPHLTRLCAETVTTRKRHPLVGQPGAGAEVR